MGTGKMKKMSRQQQKAVGASMNEAAGKMLSPNKMETPLEGNAFSAAMDKHGGDYKKAKAELDGSPNAMVGAVAGGMLGQGQVIDQGQAMSNIPPGPSSMRPQFNAITNRVAQGMFGDQYMRHASVNAPYKFPVSPAAPLQHKMKKTHIHPTEFTGEIQTKKDGQEYSLIELDGSQKVSDTLKPAGLKFPKNLVTKDKLLKGSMDLSASKTGPKTFTLNQQNN
jgi:hypothetical protein